MIGVLIQLSLLVAAGATSFRGNKLKKRVRTAKDEVKEKEMEVTAFVCRYAQLQVEAERKFQDTVGEWKIKIGDAQEKGRKIEQTLRQELQERGNEIASVKQLHLKVLHKQVEKLECQRSAFRQHATRPEARIDELRNTLGRRRGCSYLDRAVIDNFDRSI